MNEQITSDQLQPAGLTNKEAIIQGKKTNTNKKKVLKLEDLRKGDILHTAEHVVQLNLAEEGDNGSYRLHCDWGHCTADGSRDYFMNDWIECLPEHIVRLWPNTKGGE